MGSTRNTGSEARVRQHGLGVSCGRFVGVRGEAGRCEPRGRDHQGWHGRVVRRWRRRLGDLRQGRGRGRAPAGLVRGRERSRREGEVGPADRGLRGLRPGRPGFPDGPDGWPAAASDLPGWAEGGARLRRRVRAGPAGRPGHSLRLRVLRAGWDAGRAARGARDGRELRVDRGQARGPRGRGLADQVRRGAVRLRPGVDPVAGRQGRGDVRGLRWPHEGADQLRVRGHGGGGRDDRPHPRAEDPAVGGRRGLPGHAPPARPGPPGPRGRPGSHPGVLILAAHQENHLQRSAVR